MFSKKENNFWIFHQKRVFYQITKTKTSITPQNANLFENLLLKQVNKA